VCVGVSVCPAIRFRIPQRILSIFRGNILRVMTRCMGYIFCVCMKRARVCVRGKLAHMSASAYFLTDSIQICWEHTTTHHKWQGLRTVHVHAPRERAWFAYLWTDSLHICWAHTINDHKLHVLHTYHVHAPRACV
jgi:hypothetical protein